MTAPVIQPPPADSLGEQLRAAIDRLPSGPMRLGEVVDIFGDEGLLLLTALMVLVFLVPVSIPGVSTVFGGAILLVGLSRLRGRPLWLPAKLRERELPGAKVRAALETGLVWARRFERISKPHRLAWLVVGRGWRLTGDLAFTSAAGLLMAPLGLVPFSNTLPAIALLLYAIGFIQRDGGAVLVGHLAQVATVAYFAFLALGGGAALSALFG
ncbi:MAG: exopolysaccharide biosynthesis protein [Arenimonas sp. SCN 70-307]|uniref:exopolysaccharide biosynthesis protein n=1 Tax=Arenimonas sp. SCN 70-307 TaxID=1660089 RepID=UPI00086A677E|nr:exopolysaccharide biosynthesis protein [Arenimonas sp. SCN 70-307]ODS64930.1 MAG: exopolysaccharide biosynthesis protein [Arenimonas sp. SCN 70-307]